MQIEYQQYTVAEQNQTTTDANEQTLVALALSQEKVIGARCFSYEGKFVVALLTSPFYLKSERDECLNDMRTLLSQKAGTEVLVTFDMDIFRNIRDDMNDADKQRLLTAVQTRQRTLYQL